MDGRTVNERDSEKIALLRATKSRQLWCHDYPYPEGAEHTKEKCNVSIPEVKKRLASQYCKFLCSVLKP